MLGDTLALLLELTELLGEVEEEGDCELLGEVELLGLTDALGDTLGDCDADGLRDALGLVEGEPIALTAISAHTFTPFVTPCREKVCTQNSYVPTANAGH